MKTKSLCLELGRAAAMLSAIALCPDLASAQQSPPPSYGYPPGYQAPAYPQYPQEQQGYAEPPSNYQQRYVSPQEFFPQVGRRFGDMFRRLFYGDAPPPDYPANQYGGQSLDVPPPSYGSHYGPSTGLNIPPQYEQPNPLRYNTPPPQYNTQPPPQYNNAPRYETPRYEQPPQQTLTPQRQAAPAMPPGSRYSQAPAPTPKSSSKKSVQSTPPKKYTPPTITRSTSSQPKVQSQPPATAPNPEPSSSPSTSNRSATEKSSPPSTVSSNAGKGSGSKPAAAGSGSGSFLKGKRTGKEGRVTSPYPPYQELDVTGLSSGSLALDPTTQKVFEVP